MSLEEQLKNQRIQSNNSVVTIGTFDGVHIGHQSLLKFLKVTSKKFKYDPIVIVFKEQPRSIIHNDKFKLYLSTLKDRVNLISKYTSNVVTIDFNESIKNLTSEEFINILKKHYNTVCIVSGENARIGNDKKLIKNINPKIIKSITTKIEFNSEVIFSSSNIQKYIENGNMTETSKLLGRYYCIDGKVIEGKKRGHRIGFPTANMLPNNKLLIPNIGIYATIAEIKDEKFLSATSIGFNPTFEKDEKLSIETFVTDFNKNIYGEKIKLYFLEKIRDEIKFNDQKELIKQMNLDISYIKKNFLEVKKNL